MNNVTADCQKDSTVLPIVVGFTMALMDQVLLWIQAVGSGDRVFTV
jgi:hypothetical protein